MSEMILKLVNVYYSGGDGGSVVVVVVVVILIKGGGKGERGRGRRRGLPLKAWKVFRGRGSGRWWVEGLN